MGSVTNAVHRDLRPLARAALDAGWRIDRRRSGHVIWRSPTGATVVTGGTPSDIRHLLNARADLRRAGLRIT